MIEMTEEQKKALEAAIKQMEETAAPILVMDDSVSIEEQLAQNIAAEEKYQQIIKQLEEQYASISNASKK